MHIQQGDVCIESATIPKGAKKLPHRTLALGEATGHSHVAVAEDVTLFELNRVLYARVPNGTEVVHQEHRPVRVPPGDYTIGIVREYDHFTEEAREVVD